MRFNAVQRIMTRRMSATEASLVCPQAALAAKHGRGRTPVSKSNAHECRDRITAWKLTPEEKRQPPTLTALAAELGISKQLASYYSKQIPESVEQFVDDAEREALGRYPHILKALGDLAEKGNVEAMKVYIRQLAEPRRPAQRKASAMASDITLNLAIQTLIRPAEPNSLSASSAIENPPADVSLRQIPSNQNVDEESVR